MAKLNIPLNGSNYISDKRSQAYSKALDDDHQIDCGAEDQIKVSETDPEYQSPSPPQASGTKSSSRDLQSASSAALSQALEHTYNHQSRTMEIHQQYLAQQQEYMQLITAVLDQQGKVLHQGAGTGAAQLVETFQRTLDNFHTLREQGIKVHQEFLAQQSAFSDRYLGALENGGQPESGNGKVDTAPIPVNDSPSMEWIVQQPSIVVDDHTSKTDIPSQQKPSAEVGLPADVQSTPTRESSVSSAELGQTLLEIVAEKTGYPADMLELDMDLEADLGIDSIKRVEILGTLEERYPSLPPANTEILGQTRTLQEILDYMDNAPVTDIPEISNQSPAPTQPVPAAEKEPEQVQAALEGSTAVEELTEVLLEIVAEKTGYPADMLEADMDMEADLGIDSIKRVEILGAMEERVPGLPPVETEKLAELRTLGQIVEMMGKSPDPDIKEALLPESSETKKKGGSPAPEVTAIKLKTVPAADQLVLTPDPLRPLIISAGEHELTGETASLLQEQGWKVVIWSYPKETYPVDKSRLPADIPTVMQKTDGSAGIQATLEEIRGNHGVPGGLIHIHPQPGGGDFFSSQEDSLIKEVFLLAGALKDDLNQPSQTGRNLFFSVARLDGALGLENGSEFLKGSGLSGLVKTLRWEWPDVFCRFVDLDPSFSTDQASRTLLEELRDPDRGLVEVGIGSRGRVTIERDKGQNDD